MELVVLGYKPVTQEGEAGNASDQKLRTYSMIRLNTYACGESWTRNFVNTNFRFRFKQFPFFGRGFNC